MPIRPARKAIANQSTERVEVPRGAPIWVTPELIQKTLEVWQPYYDGELIADDALAMILGASRIFDLFSEQHPNEEIRRTRPRQQP